MKSKQSKATVNFSYHSLVSVKVSSERKRTIDILKILGFHRLWSKRVSLTEISKDLTRDSESYFQRRYVVQTLQCVWNAFSKACKIGLAKALYIVYWKIKIYIYIMNWNLFIDIFLYYRFREVRLHTFMFSWNCFNNN